MSEIYSYFSKLRMELYCTLVVWISRPPINFFNLLEKLFTFQRRSPINYFIFLTRKLSDECSICDVSSTNSSFLVQCQVSTIFPATESLREETLLRSETQFFTHFPIGTDEQFLTKRNLRATNSDDSVQLQIHILVNV